MCSGSPPPAPREADGQQDRCGHLGGEGLGAGDADLGARMGQDGRVRLTHLRRPGHVADRGRARAQLAREARRGQGVRGLTGLRDRERQGPLHQAGSAIAELARVVEVHRDAREALDEVARDLSGVERGATREDLHPLDRATERVVERPALEAHVRRAEVDPVERRP